MKNLNKLKIHLMEKINEKSNTIRIIEEEARKYSVDPNSGGVYIGLVGYRQALRDLLDHLGSLKDDEYTG
jgi:hypothetical protein